MREGWTSESAQELFEGEISNYANLLLDSVSVFLKAHEQPSDRRACEVLVEGWMHDCQIDVRRPVVILPPCDTQGYGLPRDRI